MNIAVRGNDKNIAVISSNDLLITDTQSALDFAMTVGIETQLYNIVLPKTCLVNDFFVLSTGLAGEVLQKYTNYGFKLAIWGDYSKYNSKPLRDFIYESNRGKNFFFVNTELEAIEKLETV
ncbi:MAG: DUF4180 domain-containing protein [Muricomes sp.]